MPPISGCPARGERPFEAYLDLLCCPACKGPLEPPGDDTLTCAVESCKRSFPIVRGRPVLIDEHRSVFSLVEYLGIEASEKAEGPRRGSLSERLGRLPSLSVNLSAVRCFETMKRTLLQASPSPLVLVVGGGLSGKGMRALSEDRAIRLINVDPSPGSAAVVLCDAHDLPFKDGSVDAVVAQAVLEHVADPTRCADEIDRVLRPTGLVYSEIPFMQQVHLRGYDFTRFSHIGHRRLFRRFTEMSSGVVAGPGTALAWSWRYFLAAFARGFLMSKILFWVGRITGFGFELFDYVLRERPGALDSASCTFFLGSKANEAVSDRTVLGCYRGGQKPPG